MTQAEYDKAQDILAVKGWLLELAKGRNMGYVDEGDGVLLTFTGNYTVPNNKVERSTADAKQPAKANPAAKHQDNRPKKTS